MGYLGGLTKMDAEGLPNATRILMNPGLWGVIGAILSL
jgi:hypothetical protein